MNDTLHDQMHALGVKARAAAKAVRDASADARTAALAAMARRLRDAAPIVLAANATDVDAARASGRAESFIDRLALNPVRLDGVVAGIG